MEDDGVSPRAGIDYRPDERLLLYLNAAQGFRPGGVNASAQFSPDCTDVMQALGVDAVFESDTLWSYELGFRAQAIEGRLDVSGAVYYIDWRDMQTPVANPPGCLGTFIDNVGKATGQGFELELSWYPNDWFELGLAAGYVESRLAVDAPSVGGKDGQRIPTVPDWTVDIHTRYEHQLGPALQGYVQADWQYVAGSWNSWCATFSQDVCPIPRKRVPSRELLSLMGGVEHDALEVDLFVDNVLDERGVLARTDDFVFGEWEMIVQPRTAGVRVSWSF